MVVAAKEEFSARIDRLEQRLSAAMRSGLQSRRSAIQLLTSHRGLAAWHLRVAMRGRHVSELTHQLKRSASALLARRAREVQGLRTRLDARDVRRQLATDRHTLATREGRLQSAFARRRERSVARLREAAARLEALSPLAVLARGYAVAWTADRTTIIRRASEVDVGDRVRVTLHQGEIECEVRSSHGSDH